MRKIPLVLVLAALLVLTDVSTFGQRAPNPQRSRQRGSQPNRTPRTSGNFAFLARSFPAEYSLLLRRTIFARDHVVQSAQSQTPRNNPPRRTEYVFRGTMIEDGTRFMAGIENRSSNRTIFYSEGGSVSGPNVRVSQIALDHIIVADRNGRRMIMIGETLDAGKPIANPATMPATMPVMANAPRPSDDPQ